MKQHILLISLLLVTIILAVFTFSSAKWGCKDDTKFKPKDSALCKGVFYSFIGFTAVLTGLGSYKLFTGVRRRQLKSNLNHINR